MDHATFLLRKPTVVNQSQDAKKIKIAFNAANISPDIATIRQFCRIPVKQMTWSNLLWLKSAVTHLIIVYSTLLSSALGPASMALLRLCDWNKFGDPGWLDLMGWTRVVKQEVRPWFKLWTVSTHKYACFQLKYTPESLYFRECTFLPLLPPSLAEVKCIFE